MYLGRDLVPYLVGDQASAKFLSRDTMDCLAEEWRMGVSRGGNAICSMYEEPFPGCCTSSGS